MLKEIKITDKQRWILDYLQEGASYKEMEKETCIPEQEIKSELNKLFRIFRIKGNHKITKLVSECFKNGLFSRGCISKEYQNLYLLGLGVSI